MNFYRVGKVVGVTANTEFFLNQSQHKHKAVLFQNGTGVGSTFKLTFHDAAGVIDGITLNVSTASTGSFNPFIYPGVVRSVTPTVTQKIVLLG